ncbi:MAG: Fe-S cluster assembly protein SufD [Alphaproteobacteria bacterium]|nr:Fe-S cluster assembly protein SufD [Alphaproteobacteria bacterium]MDE2163817.1 Fe-S cluster assembly protein SufD [Alphaproteobacteria bacterium]
MNAALPSRDARRAEALESFRERGMPHRRFEHWRYSDLRAILDAGQVAQSGTAAWHLEKAPEGVETFDLGKPDAPDWVMRNLGTIGARPTMKEASLAFADGGIALRVPRGRKIAEPARLQISSTGNVRVLLVLEEETSLTLLETHTGDAGLLRNVGVEIALASQAKLSHVRFAASALKSISVEHIGVTQARGAQYRAHFANFGSRLSRTELHILLQEEDAEAHLSGVNVLGDEGHADLTSHIEHVAGNTRSTQLFKKVAGGHSRAVYQGKITVREGANGSDSRQTAKALLLGGRAEADLKPELIIFADDVKCAHGAAVGDLDPESLFYLRSRGVPEAEARHMLVRAFLEDAVAEIENEELRAAIWQDVEHALPHAMRAAR